MVGLLGLMVSRYLEQMQVVDLGALQIDRAVERPAYRC